MALFTPGLSAAALFPPFVSYASAEVGDALAPFGDAPLPPEVLRSVPRRQVEFAAGRHCARAALARLDPALASASIPIGELRAPVWPSGIVGAITHAAGFAAAAVAREADALGVGLDTERLLSGRAIEDVAAVAASPAELRALGAQGGDRARLLTIAFSAKESIYKCLFPQVRRYFDFLDVALVGVDEAAGRFTAELLVPLGGLPAGARLEGRLLVAGELVHTAMVRTP